jgi:hypothetical protein
VSVVALDPEVPAADAVPEPDPVWRTSVVADVPEGPDAGSGLSANVIVTHDVVSFVTDVFVAA